MSAPLDPLLSLLAHLPGAVLVTGTQSPFVVSSAGGALEELLGERPAHVEGKPLAPGDAPGTAQALERLGAAASGGETAEARVRWRTPDGSLEPVAVRVVPLGDGRAAWLVRPDERIRACIDEALYSATIDPDERVEIVAASPRFDALIGSAPADMSRIEAWRARIHPDDRERVRQGATALRAGHPIEVEYRLRCADGQERTVLTRATPQPPEDGVVLVDGIVIDVGERRPTALAFADTSSRFAHVIESIDEFIYTDDAGVDGHLGRAVYASPGIFRVLGRTVPLGMLNAEWEAAVHPDDIEIFASSHERMAAGEPFEVEYRILRPDGEERWVLDRARPRRTPDGRVLIDGVIADVTDRHRMTDELRAARDEADRRSRVDALTGVFNRGHFAEALAAELDRAARGDGSVGLLIADVDHFKRVNDSYGHLVGDRVLAGIAERLVGALRRYDTLARFGGEEFVALVPDIPDLAALVATGEHLREAVRAKPFLVDGRELAITVSIGVALGRGDGTPDALIGAADDALYTAKRAGRDCVRAAPLEAPLTG